MAGRTTVVAKFNNDGSVDFDVDTSKGGNDPACQDMALFLATCLKAGGLEIKVTDAHAKPPKIPEAEAVAPARQKVRG